MPNTTIQISTETRAKLSKLKGERNTYDDLLNALLDLVPSGDEEGEYTDEFRMSILRGTLDIKRGRVHTDEEIRKKLGIN